MIKLREQFTKWYYNRGYEIWYSGEKMGFTCPFWVRPVAEFLISPSVYFHEYGMKVAKTFSDELMREINLD